MDFRDYIKNSIVLLDGAMGTTLQKLGLLKEGVPELLGLSHPKTLIDIHRSYVDAGSAVVYTNTFQANREKLPKDVPPDTVIKAAVTNAKASGAKYVALDIGPSGRLIEPMGDMNFEDAYELFREQVLAAERYGADLLVFETFSSLYEMKAALLAAKENSTLPVMCSMSFEGMRSVNGTTISSMAITLEGLGADVIGFNCSVGPEEILPAAKELLQWTNLPVMVKVNSGLPNGKTYNPAQFAYYYKELLDMGVSIIGGCCGTDPSFIQALADIMKERQPLRRKKVVCHAVCSEQNTVVLNNLKLVGERINPTGKKPFKDALITGDYAYAAREALAQVENGADLLDVNCGLPEIDEKIVLPLLVKSVQAAVQAPLMLDSSDPVALEKALRLYNGIPIVNSVNGDAESLNKVLPLVKKYGALVIGLTLDANGIPHTVEDRVAVGNRILEACAHYGIQEERVIIDALTLTAATAEYKTEVCIDTVKAFSLRNIKTALGISNVSFGLPNREYVNLAFLMQAASAGLTLAIVNPSSPLVKELTAAALALSGDFHAIRTVTALQQKLNKTEHSVAAMQQNSLENNNLVAARQQNCSSPAAKNLEYCIIKGLKDDCRQITKELLLTEDTSSIIDNRLIKALDEVGTQYETGKIFLPELIASAEAAKAAFEVLRAAMKGAPSQSKGKIVLATVKGDIHDIGKNIVRAVLENYGYTVFDLGRDVAPQSVVDVAIKEEAPLVGLSALMTTTAANMEITVTALRAAGYPGKIMVGGAVITQEYATKIGADFYAKNANASAEIAKKVFAK
ncbi:MAG: homocysteine S-methyltransferase family protein [Clostridia bacterium]|nr:homocysteine S-methyltransferase family protein [Clostridia bacterium]